MSQLSSNIEKVFLEVTEKFSDKITSPWVFIDSATQALLLVDNNTPVCQYVISTSKFGLGCEQDSFKTPLGAHIITQKIGDGQKINEIFVGRVAIGNIGEVIYEKKSSDLDLILTRILWLQGLEEKYNCGQGVDSFQRYIYIHGTHEEGLLGVPASHGCVRMSNSDVIKLFNEIEEQTFVYIC